MVLGSNILVWSILIMLLKDHMLLTRFVTLPAIADFYQVHFGLLIVLWLSTILVILGFNFEVERTCFITPFQITCVLFQNRHTFEKPVKIYN